MTHRRRRGLTFIELVIAMSIMLMIVVTLETLAEAVHQGFEYSEGQGAATQHARIAIDRLTKTASEATASEQFPGFLVLADTVGAYRFPDTLVVWHPTAAAVDPTGLPRYNELVIYCPSWYIPNQFVEITVPTDTRTVPAVTDLTTWATEITSIKKNQQAKTVVLTDLLRTCTTSNSGASGWRGAVRFTTRLNPTDADWAKYKAGTLDWKRLAWVQGIFGTQMGLRQSWVRWEFQLMPVSGIVAQDIAAQQPIPFFGSADVFYGMHK